MAAQRRSFAVFENSLGEIRPQAFNPSGQAIFAQHREDLRPPVGMAIQLRNGTEPHDPWSVVSGRWPVVNMPAWRLILRSPQLRFTVTSVVSAELARFRLTGHVAIGTLGLVFRDPMPRISNGQTDDANGKFSNGGLVDRYVVPCGNQCHPRRKLAAMAWADE